ncbi:type IV pilus secretin PilQ [Denitromonas ohlonensis]|uniref:Type IV pilus biogenesis and competence protein PilQ n=2 Tax=Denitromonas TaxID=139331 RepID=A0A557SKK3_9RHOO|nr:type IV pilus secretin PilQ [Denitromonas ohlonensis]TVO68127.1 type IV pilus secretin PilQ [Denitromonas ohlonensis]TVO77968.1 type IV pilus secretin PilQ [Denitromonas ohlonensis]
MKFNMGYFVVAAGLWMAQATSPVMAQATMAESVTTDNAIEALDVSRQGASIYVKVRLKTPLAQPPASFSVASPARIAFDFPGTGNELGRSLQTIDEGDLRSANIVQVGDRTRLVLNLVKLTPYDTRVEGQDVVIALSPVRREPSELRPNDRPFASFAETNRSAATADGKFVRDINFRRGTEGEGRIVVELSDPDTGIDIRQQGDALAVDFLKTKLPENLRRKSDVTDFATPVTEFVVQPQGANTRLLIKPNGLWEHNAYQSDNQFVVEIKRVVEDPKKLVQGARGKFQGDKLSLNFQNIDVRSVLQVIADFTDFNIITSDTVQGSLTLRLKDVPWDQALDIILQSKGLDMRKHGNVIWIAPRDELAAREKLELEALAQIGDLEPLKTESFQINYHKAKEIFDFLKDKNQTVLSKRGSVIVDERSNKVFVTDVGTRLDDLHRLIQEIDIPPRQVLIEARIVEADKGFARDLGVRMGIHMPNAPFGGPGGSRAVIGGGLGDTGFHTGQTSTTPDFFSDSLGVNLPASPSTGTPSQLSLILFNSAATRFLNLELSALEVDNRGRVVSSPRVLTANQVEAIMEQGTEIPYQSATSSGATSVQFRKAVLSLKVRPNITPDGRVQLFVDVNKDKPGATVPGGVAIDTKHVKTEVMVENGGTVVIGGVYEEEETKQINRVPFLGEIPVVGALFRNTQQVSNRKELLVFITPRIVTQALSLR